jgi:catechol 1,2-dioxygenase
MTVTIFDRADVQALLRNAAGLDEAGGDPRLKAIMHRVLSDLFRTIEEFDIQPDEFWAATSYLAAAGPEMGLIAPGLGFEHFLDLRLDEAEKAAGLAGGTPRTIEGPLYVGGAPLSKGEARLDDGAEAGEVLFMEGVVTGSDGKPIPGAVVDVWHANTMGNYSFFDPSQAPYNLRRRIETDENGRYRFRSLLPVGYGVPPGGSTEKLLDQIGRVGKRPAHVHFFVSAPGYRHLTTQINIAGDEYLHKDFAYGTRDELIPEVIRHEDPQDIHARGLNSPYVEIPFNFVLHKEVQGAPQTVVRRQRVEA